MENEENGIAIEYYYFLSREPYQPHVKVQQSLIPNAGLGLFVQCAYQENETICEYLGLTFSTKEAMKIGDKSYLMRLGPQIYIDAKLCYNVMARYINDCRHTLGHNVTFIKNIQNRNAMVVATRDIVPGEELYVDYGKWYWIAYDFNRKT